MHAARGIGISDLPRHRKGDGAPARLHREIQLIVVRPGVRTGCRDARNASETGQTNREPGYCDKSFHRHPFPKGVTATGATATEVSARTHAADRVDGHSFRERIAVVQYVCA
jgi:hypothetical protein